MKIDTSRFGPVTIEADDVIRFAKGLMGLEDCRDWVLLADTGSDAFAWLQSVDRPEVALVVASPRRFLPDYQLRVTRHELEPLLLDEVKSARILVVVGKTEHSMTLNLKAPLVVNLERRLGRQVIDIGDTPARYELGIAPPTLKKSA